MFIRNFKKAYEPSLKVKERVGNALIIISLVFLSAVVIYMVALMVKDYNKPPRHDDGMLTVLYEDHEHRVFYDTETGVMYVEYGNHGGISPMYNPDGSLRVYKE